MQIGLYSDYFHIIFRYLQVKIKSEHLFSIKRN